MSAAFDPVKAKSQLKVLKQKAQKARSEGNKDMAASFRSGARRLSRKLAHCPPPPAEAKASE